MVFSNVVKLYKHFSYLADGKFTERDFDSKVQAKKAGEEAGWTAMGEMSSDRKQLIKSDALANKIALEEKFPELKEGAEEPAKQDNSISLVKKKPKKEKKEE